MAYGKKEKRNVSSWTPERIKGLRARYGENQPCFAARLRVSTETLRWWEQNKGSPSGPAELYLDRLLEDIDSGQIREISASQHTASAS
jgi:DNA-binding transcriptional regulator YiaG